MHVVHVPNSTAIEKIQFFMDIDDPAKFTPTFEVSSEDVPHLLSTTTVAAG